MSDERVRIEIGFEGGQIMGLHVTISDADRLERGLAESAAGSVDLEIEDGRCTVVLGRVSYLKRFSRESRVGFGA
jgi:hypothetical protein